MPTPQREMISAARELLTKLFREPVANIHPAIVQAAVTIALTPLREIEDLPVDE